MGLYINNTPSQLNTSDCNPYKQLVLTEIFKT